MTRRWVPRRAWRILRPGHTRRARRPTIILKPGPNFAIGIGTSAETDERTMEIPQPVEEPTADDDWPDRHDWPGPDLSPCTADLMWEDEIRRQIEARRRGDGGGS